MNGIAPLLGIFLIVLGTLGGALTLSVVFPGTGKVQPADGGPVQIVSNAASHVNWDDVKQWLFGIPFGFIIFIANYIILPLMNWVASVLAGRAITFPPIIGYAAVIFLGLMVLWRKKQQIYEFAMTNILRVAVIVGAVFLIGVVLIFLGAI